MFNINAVPILVTATSTVPLKHSETLKQIKKVTNQNFCEYEVIFKARNQTNIWTNASSSNWQYQ
jgi:hypothetical protein